jgi:hypothetical protein
VNSTAVAARGFVAVLVAALAFFGFVIASGTLGDFGQAAVGTAIGIAVLLYLWSRLNAETRERLSASARRLRRHAPDET